MVRLRGDAETRIDKSDKRIKIYNQEVMISSASSACTRRLRVLRRECQVRLREKIGFRLICTLRKDLSCRKFMMTKY